MAVVPTLTLTPTAEQIQAMQRASAAWLDRLVAKYGLPRAVLIRMLDRPGALEDEIAQWIVERAEAVAYTAFQTDAQPPAGDDLFSRAVRGVHGRLTAQRDAAAAAERQRQYQETDDLLRRIKAGEEVDL